MKVGFFLNTQFKEGESLHAHLPAMVEQVRAAYERKLKDDLLAQLRAKTKVSVNEDALRDFRM